LSVVLGESTASSDVLRDEYSEFARAAVAAALADGLIVPILWSYEVQNGLSVALRRKRIDFATAQTVLDRLRSLRAQLRVPCGLGEELRLAHAYALTAYDAAYLAVALATGATLATNEKRMRDGAERLGSALFKLRSADDRPA
jgi:predicted nucleic acid-binding protein